MLTSTFRHWGCAAPCSVGLGNGLAIRLAIGIVLRTASSGQCPWEPCDAVPPGLSSPRVHPPQSAYFNPGILMAVTVRGNVPAGDFFALLSAEIVGYFAGEWVGRSCPSLVFPAGAVASHVNWPLVTCPIMLLLWYVHAAVVCAYVLPCCTTPCHAAQGLWCCGPSTCPT